MNIALFGYKENDNLGDFIAESNSIEKLKEIEKKAATAGYIKFQYVYADGTKPNFTASVNL